MICNPNRPTNQESVRKLWTIRAGVGRPSHLCPGVSLSSRSVVFCECHQQTAPNPVFNFVDHHWGSLLPVPPSLWMLSVATSHDGIPGGQTFGLGFRRGWCWTSFRPVSLIFQTKVGIRVGTFVLSPVCSRVLGIWTAPSKTRLGTCPDSNDRFEI